MTDREEWRIKQLEEEARHEHAMRLLQGQRLDVQDESLAEVRATLKETSLIVNQLAVSQAKTEKMLQDLIRAITKEHPNGHGKE